MKAFIQKYSDDIKYDILISQTPNKKSNEINYDILNKYQINKINYNSIKFNKDNNLHINWISCAANLRASNYNIPLEDEYVIKGIAGRIIPAVITTTAAVSGLILIEFLKYIFQIINRSEYNIYRSNFINLAEPIIIYSQPIEAPLIDIAGVKINSWQKFEYKNNTTLKKFKLYYENMFQISINMIVHDTTIIYADDFMEDNLDNYLDNIINNLNINQSNTKIIFILIAIDEIKELPNINIIL
jgi:ubiquitin-activating enzyme E1